MSIIKIIKEWHNRQILKYAIKHQKRLLSGMGIKQNKEHIKEIVKLLQ